MSVYCTSVRSMPRWPCYSPPISDQTDFMLALILFQILWSVSRVGSPWIGVIFDRSKRVSL